MQLPPHNLASFPMAMVRIKKAISTYPGLPASQETEVSKALIKFLTDLTLSKKVSVSSTLNIIRLTRLKTQFPPSPSANSRRPKLRLSSLKRAWPSLSAYPAVSSKNAMKLVQM